jgi:hypothetical protein
VLDGKAVQGIRERETVGFLWNVDELSRLVIQRDI